MPRYWKTTWAVILVIAVIDAVLNKVFNGVTAVGMVICFAETVFSLGVIAFIIAGIIKLFSLAKSGVNKASRRD